jgi:hypothetical protein
LPARRAACYPRLDVSPDAVIRTVVRRTIVHAVFLTSGPHADVRSCAAHRLDREARVLQAVMEGAETVAAITDTAYERDVSGVRDLAEATVEAHLEKLAIEGRVAWDGVRASVREASSRGGGEAGL